MRTNAPIGPALAAALCALAIAACDRETTAQAERTGASVGQKIDKALDRTQEKLAEAGQATEEKLSEAGKELRPKLDEAGRKISAANTSDTAITASIKTDFLKDPDLSVLKIDVDTQDGVVTLNGLAENDAARARAEKLAGAIKGVKEVRNHLTVKKA